MRGLGRLLWGVAILGGVLLGFYWLSSQNQPKRSAYSIVASQGRPDDAWLKSPPAGERSPNSSEEELPHQVLRGGFVSSESCRACHAEAFESWHQTYHRSMTQAASPETVLAPFDNVYLTSRGQTYELTREGDEFFVTMPDPDYEAGAAASGWDVSRINAPRIKTRIVMTSGSHNVQGYWVSSSHKNMLRQFPWNYVIADKRWVSFDDFFMEPPGGDPHMMVWNDNCIVCHATGANPNFDLRKKTVSTEVVELGVACEACHGPGESHVLFHEDVASRTSSKDPILHPKKCDSRISSEVCGQCHSYFMAHDVMKYAENGYSYRAGGSLSDSQKLITFNDARISGDAYLMGLYWKDGTCRIGGREYTSMVDSPCYQNGSMSCISCHSMHNSDPNDQLAAKMDGNDACLQCHSTISERLEAHTHHATESSGSQCYNCHMPHTTYAQQKAIRSHRVQVPQIASRAERDQPNACNLCHLDQTMAWTATMLNEWYGQPLPTLRNEEETIAASLLWLLKGDAAQRVITAWHMGWSPALETAGKAWQLPFLAQLLDDDYAAVRSVASKALSRYAEFSELRYDFTGSPDARQLGRERTMNIWSRNPVIDAQAEELTQLLFDPATGQVDLQRIDELLRLQDKRKTYFPE